MLVTLRTGTIIIPDDTFNAIGNGYIPDIPGLDFLPAAHKLTLLLGLIVIVLYIVGEINTRKNKMAYNFEVLSPVMFILKLTSISILTALITRVLAGYNGSS